MGGAVHVFDRVAGVTVTGTPLAHPSGYHRQADDDENDTGDSEHGSLQTVPGRLEVTSGVS